jgi:PKD repeat protein
MTRSKHVIFLAVLLLFGFSSGAPAEEWISLDGSTEPVQPEVTVIVSNDSRTVIEYNLSGFTRESMNHDGHEYQSLRLPGHFTTLDVGKPQLPVINKLIAVPAGARLSVSVAQANAILLDGYNVYPFQTPLKETETPQRFDMDEAFYHMQSNPYPGDIAVAGTRGQWRHLNVVKLIVQPFQFNPAAKELTVYTDLRIRLDFEEGYGYGVTTDRPISATYDRIYSSAILNYDLLDLPKGNGDGPDAPYDMLIIAEDIYVDNMNSFVAWKNSKGISTQVTAMSTVGSTVADVKNYITQEYNNNNISYVLLVGNETDIPMYTGYGFVSDYYYSLIAGSDNYADIAIGRFCVHSEANCNTMVSKSVAFEQNPPAGDWLDNTVLVANWELAPGKYQGCKEEIRTATYSYLAPDFTTQYGASTANGGDEASNADVIASINAGQRLVNYRGHGSETAWTYWNVYGEYFGLPEVASLNNGAMTPVIFGIACLNANLSHTTNTLAEAFTLDSEGAVAYLGASDPSYTTANHTYDKQLYLSTFHDGVPAIGDISNIAATRIINDHGSTGLTNARMYFWLGDPTLEIIYQGAGPSYAGLPYSTGFESGSLDQYWTTRSDNSEGRILVTTANTPRGSYHLTMDDNLNGSLYAQNEAWLHVDLSGQSNVNLSFWWKEFSDEDHTQDGVFFSDDGGGSFTKVHSLIGGTATYQQIALDVDQLAAANGLSLTGTFVIKFQQYDNYGITTDGMAFDDVSVTATGGSPPVADFVGTPTSGTAPLTVDFTDLSTNSPTSWYWTFGDGGTSTNQDPSYEYTSAGTYTVTLTATNAFGSDDETKINYITVNELSVNYASVPYTTGFESGSFDQYWTSQSDTAEGRIQVTTANVPRGSYHLTMDDTTGNTTYNQNEALLHVDLSGQSNVDLAFWWKEWNDEDHTQDGVFFSDDGGSSFAKVHSLVGGTTTYQQIVLDVDQLAASNGLSLTGTFVIKFQQYDNYPISSDGFAIDDVSVTGGGGGTYASLPYSTGFESGAFDQYWFTQSDNTEGRILLTTANVPRGSYHLTMDDNLNGSLFAQNEAWLRVDLAGLSDVNLTFWWKEFADEDHTQDGVFFSDNGGGTFTKVHSLVGGTSTYQEISLDVDQLAATHGLSLTGTFVIKFQQYDNYGIATDGMAFDDVSVTEGGAYASVPYSTGFETGAFDQYWFTQSDNAEGRIQLTTANVPRGSYHLTMDDNLNGGLYAQNEAWLLVNLSGLSNVNLSFWWKEFADEDHTQDGVFFSDDGGGTFTKVHSLVGGTSTYQQIVLDIDQLAATYGLSLTGTFVIKFQQYDNYGITTDGMAFDDVYVTPVVDHAGGRIPLTAADTSEELE